MHEKSIELLNKAIADELQAIHQYMYFHFHCEDIGYDPLSLMFRRIAIEEMGHVEKCAERILFLKGDVDMEPAGPIEQIRDVRKMLAKAKEMEAESAKEYNVWANECAANADAGTKIVFESLVSDEERHCDTFETQEENIEKFGEQFLALQSIERSKSEGGPGEAAH